MRLDFNVLWVDDQPDRVQAQIQAIALYMQEQGFDFKPTLCRSMEEVQGSLSDSVFNDEIDLLLLDWDLGGGLEGQTVIAKVRALVRYKDIVFYSAGQEPEALRQRAYAAKLEGVYCASRELLVDEVKGVFDSLIKKVLDLDHTRGIVMGATADIDHIVSECLSLVHATVAPAAQKIMLEKALDLIEGSLENSQKKIGAIRETTDLTVLVSQNHNIFTAYHRLRILKSTLKDMNVSDGPRFEKALSDYIGNVVPDRNILGHVILVPEGKPNAVIGADDKPMALDNMRELRKRILGLRVDFRELHTELAAKAPVQQDLPQEV